MGAAFAEPIIMQIHKLSATLGVLLFYTAHLILAAPTKSSASWPDCSPTADTHYPHNGTMGSYQVNNFTAMWEGHPIVAMYPSGAPSAAPNGKFPLVVFMHGVTGAIEMYVDNFKVYVSHGFIVVFPYIKNPKQDRNPLTTNTNGEFILKGIDFTRAASTNASSPLNGIVDMDMMVVAGHSMGATDSIMSARRAGKGDSRVPQKDSIKLVVTQHPGICGPFGPPPWPSTWMKSDLIAVAQEYPMLFTTATNDAAFWPAPHTAEHELGCFKGAISNSSTTKPSTFVQFSASACNEDGAPPPWTDAGHDCPFKTAVESPWVLTALKLYVQQNGNLDSQCAKMLYGTTSDSLQKDAHVEKFVFRSNPLPGLN